MARKCTICVDFDGVLHSYTSKFTTIDEIKDPPVTGAFEWLEKMVNYEQGDNKFEICIYSSRSQNWRGVRAMQAWFLEHGLKEEVLRELSFPTQKPAASMTIDDRAYLFEGYFPTADYILNFKPWNKR